MDINTFLAGLGDIFAAGRKDEVGRYLQSGLARAEAEGDEQAEVTILNEMIGYYRVTSSYPDSITYAERAMRLMRKMGYADSVEYGTTMLNAATAYKASGDSGKALELFNAVLDIYSRGLDPGDSRLAALYNNLSSLHQDNGDYEKAAMYLEKAAGILFAIKGAENDAATVYTNLALALFALRRDSEGMAHLRTALALFESTAENGMADSRAAPHYAGALAALAGAHYRNKEYAKAVRVYESALERIKDCYGENRDYAVTCRNCAAACEALGNTERAAELRRKAETALAAIGLPPQERDADRTPVCAHADSTQQSGLTASPDEDARQDQAPRPEEPQRRAEPPVRPARGLEIARAYYEACGREMIRSRFSAYENRIAVGLVGEGSECLGFDDEISRDHDFGPSFCLWLPRADYRKYGAELQSAYEALPGGFMGLPDRVESASAHTGSRVGVLCIEDFYYKYIGTADAALSLAQWLALPESSLATACNGEVFGDPLGEFSRIRQRLLDYYPEDVRLKKIAARAALMAQSGQVNYARCMSRGESVGAFMALAEFVKHAASMIFLLNRRYAPFYKWTHRALRELPLLPETAGLLHGLAVSRVDESNWRFAAPQEMARAINRRDSNVRIIEELCGLVKTRLCTGGLSDAVGDFLLPHAESVSSRIVDPDIRSLHIMEG